MNMIDVIFFLLVYFMLSSLAMTKFNGMKVNLPKTTSQPGTIQQDVILTIQKNGELWANRKVVTLKTLGPELLIKMRQDPQGVVIINADKNANYGLIIHAMNAARAVGIRKFALASQTEKP
jgi:biopolymer transport protein ExbD